MAMYKGKKQKIYGRGYRYSSRYGKKNNAPKIITTILLCIALVVCGYFIPTLFRDEMGEKQDTTSQASEVLNNSSLTVSYEDIDDTSSSESRTLQIKSEGDVYVAQYSEYADENAISITIDKAKNGGFDTLMLNIKSQDGILHYDSTNELAIEADAVDDTVDLAAVITQIKAAGLSAGVKINVFDEYCLAWHDRNTALLANVSTKTLWYDFVTRDITSGSPWLNPANEVAQKYNLDIITELTAFDIDSIYLEGVHFPVWGKISVYKLSEDINREEVITDFVSKAREITKNSGKSLGVIVPLCGAVGDYNERWESYGYPQDIYTLDADTIIVDARADRIFIQSWYNEMTVGELVIDDFANADAAQYAVIMDKITERYIASGSKADIAFWVYESVAALLPQDEIVNKMIKS